MNRDTAHSPVLRPGPTQHTAPARHFAILLSATPRGARLARRLAAEELHRWGWPYDTEANRTVSLLVAELATNAVRHGRVRGRDFRLRLALRPGGQALRIEVTDARPERRPPAPGAIPPPFPDLDTGRGLLLVEALSTRWGATDSDPYTKTVWCEVALT
ncbi:ATP-binding protein [Streptomyces sp. NBC_00257]|uniref:ATP-binding protein n=1 Tax=unclassified Streptomyces TaxID=2593676 RepID=UPI002252A0B1|nr:MULTISPECIES: ATP-binding protein [unclassified Streptomyces]MCX5428400.1 ATP-binding protein [Streptomyces sp. NBC_00062]